MAQPAKQRGKTPPRKQSAPPPRQTAALPAKTQAKPLEKIKQWIGAKSDLFITLLGSEAAAKRFAQTLLLAIVRNPSLQTCDLKSLFNAALFCAQRGLEPGVPDGAALVPFKGQVTPIPQYRALVKQGVETGSVKKAKAILVHENDFTEWEEGDSPKFTHKPAAFGTPRGKVVGAYSRIELPDGTLEIEPMDLEDIFKRRDSSAAWKDVAKRNATPWATWENEMIKKTALKNGFRTIPVAPKFRDLLDADSKLEGGASIADVLDIQVTDVLEIEPSGEPEPEPATKTEALASKLAGAAAPETTQEQPETEAPEVSGQEPEVTQEPGEEPQASVEVETFQQRAQKLGVEKELLASFKLNAWDDLSQATPEVLTTMDKYLAAHEAKATQ